MIEYNHIDFNILLAPETFHISNFNKTLIRDEKVYIEPALSFVR